METAYLAFLTYPEILQSSVIIHVIGLPWLKEVNGLSGIYNSLHFCHEIELIPPYMFGWMFALVVKVKIDR